MSDLNFFKNYPCTWRTWYGFWGNICYFFRSVKWSCQRALRGYSDYDCWSVDSYLIRLIPSMLRQLARDTHGTPLQYEKNPEEWSNELCRIAELLERSNEDNDYFDNPYKDEYFIAITKNDKHKRDELIDAYLDVESENYKKRKVCFDEAWDWLKIHHEELWD